MHGLKNIFRNNKIICNCQAFCSDVAANLTTAAPHAGNTEDLLDQTMNNADGDTRAGAGRHGGPSSLHHGTWNVSYCLQSPRHGNCHATVSINLKYYQNKKYFLMDEKYFLDKYIFFGLKIFLPSGAAVVLLPLGQRVQAVQLQRVRRQHEHLPLQGGVRGQVRGAGRHRNLS